uniref:Adp/atp transporter on adenylate translocase n=1 Tax=Triatoma infestans TaxID=30076 RepID=A0A170X9F1_TRIIF
MFRPRYSTVYGCLANIYRKEGIRGLFRGFLISQATVIVNRALFFGLYDLFKFGQLTNF